MLGEKRHRDVMDRFRFGMNRDGRDDVHVKRPLEFPAHILRRGELDDLVLARDPGRLGIEHHDPPVLGELNV